ncbi:MAG: hypothetical protein ACRYGI_06420 [Janthinobacterium lividum]
MVRALEDDCPGLIGEVVDHQADEFRGIEPGGLFLDSVVAKEGECCLDHRMHLVDIAKQASLLLAIVDEIAAGMSVRSVTKRRIRVCMELNAAAALRSSTGADERYTSAAYLRSVAVPVVERYGRVRTLSQDAGHSGVFDPAYPAFVHTYHWWKEGPAGGLEPKRKEFEATALGFRTHWHDLKPRTTPEINIDIEVRMPGIQIEHISGSRNSACILTAATPASKGFTDLHRAINWTMPRLAPAKSILRHMLRTCLKREHDVAARPGVVKPGKIRPTFWARSRRAEPADALVPPDLAKRTLRTCGVRAPQTVPSGSCRFGSSW